MEQSKIIFKYPLILIRYCLTAITSIIGIKIMVMYMSPQEFGLLNYKLSLVILALFVTELFNYSYLYNIEVYRDKGIYRPEAIELEIAYIGWKFISILILGLVFILFVPNIFSICLFVAWSLNTLFLTLLYGRNDIYHTQIGIMIDECLQPVLFLLALICRNVGSDAINSIVLAFILSSFLGSIYLLSHIKNLKLKIPSIKLIQRFIFVSISFAFVLNYELIALNLDKYILSLFTDFETIGLYSGAQKIAITPYMIVNAFLLITLPVTHDRNVLKLLKIISGFIILISIFVIVLFSPLIFKVFLTMEYHNPLLTICLLIPAVFVSLSKIIAVEITDYKSMFIKSAFVFGVYVILGMYLSSIFGIWGIVLTQNVSALLLYVLINYDLDVILGGYEEESPKESALNPKEDDKKRGEK